MFVAVGPRLAEPDLGQPNEMSEKHLCSTGQNIVYGLMMILISVSSDSLHQSVQAVLRCSMYLLFVLKARQLCICQIEWLILNVDSCVTHQARLLHIKLCSLWCF